MWYRYSPSSARHSYRYRIGVLRSIFYEDKLAHIPIIHWFCGHYRIHRWPVVSVIRVIRLGRTRHTGQTQLTNYNRQYENTTSHYLTIEHQQFLKPIISRTSRMVFSALAAAASAPSLATLAKYSSLFLKSMIRSRIGAQNALMSAANCFFISP